MTCLKLWNVGIYLFANDTKISRQNNQRKRTLATIRHKFIGAMVSEMATHFSPKKCHVLTLGIFYNITHTDKYTLHWQELENVLAEKDLGVILDAELKVCEHILVKIKQANALVGLIRRTFSSLDGPLFKKLFSTFIRPHLEYDKVICTPHLEKIYNYFGNCATSSHKIGGWFSSYELLRKAKKMNLSSLVYRRAQGDIIWIFNIFTLNTIVRYLKISDLETVRVENTSTNWYGKQLKMTWEDSRQIFSTSERSKHGMSCQKKLYMPSLSTYLKTNWMKRGRICQYGLMSRSDS